MKNGTHTTEEGNYWFKDDKLHREDGPAVEKSNGDKEWWLYGRQLLEKEYEQWFAIKEFNRKINLKPKSKKV